MRALATKKLCELDDPLTYLIKTMANVARSQRRREDIHRKALTRLGPADHAPRDHPSDLDFLWSIDSATRAALVLIDLEGHTYQYVARVLGTTPVALRARVSRARRRLRRELLKGGDT